MNICYLADAGSVHTARWANHFSSRGHGVEIISYRQAQGLSQQVSTHVIRELWPFGLDHFVSTNKIRDILKKTTPDIVHAHYASSYGTLGRLSGFHPYVLSVWGSDIFDFPRRSSLHRQLIKRNLAAADRVCSTSHNMAVEAQAYYNGPITVTPFGIDCDVFSRAPNVTSGSDNEFVVGTVKALEDTYGIKYLIQSFDLFCKNYRGAKKLRLVIAGGGTRARSLRRLAHDLGLADRISFLGPVPHSHVPEVLNSFSVYCALSLHESFGVAVLEASACEIPVVATNVGGLPEVVRDQITGFIVPPRDIRATAIACGKLVENESVRRAMGAAGREFVLQNYEWQENAKRMEDVYESVVRAHRSQSVLDGTSAAGEND
jgi:L-malate glycosyltransferase